MLFLTLFALHSSFSCLFSANRPSHFLFRFALFPRISCGAFRPGREREPAGNPPADSPPGGTLFLLFLYEFGFFFDEFGFSLPSGGNLC